MMDSQRQLSRGEPALEVKDLRVIFNTYAGVVKALDGVEIKVYKREMLGLVGESGCGKSVTALAIAGLLPVNARVLSGQVLLHGEDLLKKSKKEMRVARLEDIALVFQDPATYLNPIITIGSQITEIFTGNLKIFKEELIRTRLEHIDQMLSSGEQPERTYELEAERQKLLGLAKSGKLSSREGKRLAQLRAVEFLKLVKLPEPERIFKMYPFELSGGMRQRAMIAMALVRRPKVLLADEITTALDVTVQAQILRLLKELRDKIDASIILITHDLGIVAETCDRAAVMYAGNIVELADVFELFKNPCHPYTKGLFAAVPQPDVTKELESIKGSVPNLITPPSGCRFHPRCNFAFEKCPLIKPPMIEVSPGHFVACLLFGGA
jgi:peptide/nickel transport system ATP-binding protein